MSTTTPPRPPADLEGVQPNRHGHPTPRQYVNVAIILGVLTAVEVSAAYFELPKAVFVGALVLLAVAKFAMVVGYYMHLKFDNKMFRRVFVFGLQLAVAVFVLVLVLFTFGPAPAQAA